MATRELEGNVALVTGASAGIGRAVALELARAGADVALLARTREKLEAVAGEIETLGRKGLVVPVDVSRPEEIGNAVQFVLESFDRIHILVNNAGVTRDGLLLRMGDDDWDVVLDTNLKAAFLFSRAVARHFLRQRSGKIINVSSIAGLSGNPGQSNYAASKGGLNALTYTLARELGSRGIQVNAVAPGFIETQMTASLPESALAAARERIPLGRFGDPGEVARVVAFLAGPGSSYVNGTVVRVDGGLGI